MILKIVVLVRFVKKMKTKLYLFKNIKLPKACNTILNLKASH